MGDEKFDDVEERLRQVLADNLKVEKSRITRKSRMQDWGGDSLAFLEATFEIESHFDIALPDTRDERIMTFEGLVQCIKSELANKANAGARA